MDWGIRAGDTDKTIYLRLRDATTGLAKTGLAFNSAGAVASYTLPLAARAAITLATQTVTGAHSDGGFVEVDATNCKGLYRLDLPDAAIASGAFTVISIEFDGTIEESVMIELGMPRVNVAQWLGTAVATPTVAGVPEVDATHWNGTAVTTPPAVNATQISGDGTAADNLEAMLDGTGGVDLDLANVTLTAGLTVTQSTLNTPAVSLTGNGTGAGLYAIGGTTGHGAYFVGGGTSGDGMHCHSGTTAGNGATFEAHVATNGNGLAVTGVGSGSGLAANTITATGALTAGTNAIPWNANWDTEVQSECADALTAYDPPTHDELLGYFQLALRTDAGIATDRATELAAINADEGSGPGAYNNTANPSVNVAAISGDTTAADNAEAFFDGTGYAGTGNTIPTVTTVTNLTNAPTAGDLTATMKTSVQTAAAAALTAYDPPTKAELDTAVSTIRGVDLDTLKTLSDQIDGLSTSAAPQLLQNTTIATLATQTSFTLTAGSADDGAYDGAVIVVTDSATATQKAVGLISTYTGATKTVTLSADPGIFTMAVGDTVDILANITSAPTVTQIRQEIDSNSTQLAAIVADTSELQADWANGGRLDLILDDILTDTGTTIPGTITTVTTHLTDIKGATFSGATDSLEAIRNRGDIGWVTATGFSTIDAAGVRAAVGLASANLDTQLGDVPTNAELAAAITTGLTTALTEGYRGAGATGSVRDLLYELIAHMGESSISSTTKTLKRIDGTTTAKTYTLNSATTPTSVTETS